MAELWSKRGQLRELKLSVNTGVVRADLPLACSLLLLTVREANVTQAQTRELRETVTLRLFRFKQLVA